MTDTEKLYARLEALHGLLKVLNESHAKQVSSIVAAEYYRLSAAIAQMEADTLLELAKITQKTPEM